MINVRELRIGNCISYNGCKYEVSGISKQQGEEYQINAINTQKDVINVPSNECTPIVLDERLLQDIGFEPFGDTGLMKLKVFDFLKIIAIVGEDKIANIPKIGISIIKMHLSTEDDIRSIEGREFLHIKYLHQLQNLYSSLRQSELF